MGSEAGAAAAVPTGGDWADQRVREARALHPLFPAALAEQVASLLRDLAQRPHRPAELSATAKRLLASIEPVGEDATPPAP